MASVDIDTIGMASIIAAGVTMAIGSIGPAIGEGWALSLQAGYQSHE